ncbi:sulfate reduction electron transfer complex DsrMKJOP subunit DsrJ [Maridesulfovibrio ferrireducens]|uniref:sulfate reduction electron transfer complex DsrMKJOP subunit DsrJ n=1 Tax=Maridesulfovibrio ferrireducens TaxID=246191 RepID=UPI001A1A8096|nr:sulfate reduction electron transfer complex DsrMKJOP subunit DsrJ [Maridesulfovibrio ferrireducens]MBI9112035.1 sulfate reduction electron transfer complex DsrMKJOP subunit DsrJ [Maridesulfovibrio ferrireducens]
MQYGGKIIAGLVIFLGLVSLPFWFNMGGTYEQPKVELPKNAKECVAPKEEMRTSHMQLLDEWRDMALREGKRTYISANGKEYTISLQNTCMECHTSKEQFCDKCHTDAGVTPYCWDCHVPPKEAK